MDGKEKLQEKWYVRSREIVIENEKLHRALASLRYVARHLSCLYGGNQEENAYDPTMHCCEWNEVYHQCILSDAIYAPKGDEVEAIAALLSDEPDKSEIAKRIAANVIRELIERGWSRPTTGEK